MKTKTYLRYISCVLAVLLCVASIMPIAFADSTNHGNSESLLTGSNYSVSYSMNGKDVVEQLTIRDGGVPGVTLKNLYRRILHRLPTEVSSARTVCLSH